MRHLVQGNALKIQVTYLVADTPNASGILTCDVMAMTKFARFLSMVVVSLMIFASELLFDPIIIRVENKFLWDYSCSHVLCVVLGKTSFNYRRNWLDFFHVCT